MTQCNNSKSEAQLHPGKFSDPRATAIISNGVISENRGASDVPKATASGIAETRNLATGIGLYRKVELVTGTTAIEPDDFIM